MKYANIVIPFVGGLGMFIYGMQMMAQGLEHAAGRRMKSVLEALTKNKFAGVMLGAVITAVIQSSSATTVMVIGFVNAGIMNLTQAVGIIMGANVGTTATGWLVSAGEWAKILRPDTIAPIAILSGVIIQMTGKRHTMKELSHIVIGFGLLFVGISTMSDAVKPLRESVIFRNLFLTLGGNPLLGILAGTIVTAIIQSSSASVGILQSLAATGAVPFQTAVYLIMGQNIGTCITAMFSGIGAKKTAKTAAVIHLLFNVIGTILFSAGAVLFFRKIDPAYGTSIVSQTQISSVHTIFNVATTLLLFPFSGLLIRTARWIVGEEKKESTERLLSLDDRMLGTPPLALQAMKGEGIRIGKLVMKNLDTANRALFELSASEIKKVKRQEEQIDQLCAGITDYAIQLSGLQLNEKEHGQIASLLQVISDLERVSDHCENFAEVAEQMCAKDLTFSEQGKEELQHMARVCMDSFQFALQAYEEESREKALQAIGCETKADALEVELRTGHINRLANGRCHAETGILFVDVLVGMERISDHARNIAEEVLEQ